MQMPSMQASFAAQQCVTLWYNNKLVMISVITFTDCSFLTAQFCDCNQSKVQFRIPFAPA